MSVPKLIALALTKKGITNPDLYGKEGATAIKTYITLPQNAEHNLALAAIFNAIKTGDEAKSLIEILSKPVFAGETYPNTLKAAQILLGNGATVKQVIEIFERLTTKHADALPERLEDISGDDTINVESVNEYLELEQQQEGDDGDGDGDADADEAEAEADAPETVDFDGFYTNIAPDGEVSFYQDEDGNFAFHYDGNKISNAILQDFEHGLLVIDFAADEPIYPVSVRVKSLSIESLAEVLSKLLTQTGAAEDAAYIVSSAGMVGRVLTIKLEKE